jgi:GDP-4-dehydro-6-deoxy-D-mannose reductase
MDQGVPGHAYNVCSGRVWRIRDLLDQLLRTSTARVHVSVDRDRLRPTDVPVMRGSAARIHAETGWTPTTAVESSLADMLDWWRRAASSAGA